MPHSKTDKGVPQTGAWAVVTGAASGLGFAFAKELSQACNLVLIDLDATGLEAVRDKLLKDSQQICIVPGDVKEAETWAQARVALNGVVPEWLVQCAGIAVSGKITEAPIEHWRKALEVNFLSVVLGCQTFAADMARTGRGHIVHIASRAAITAVPAFGPYTASKAAVVALSETLYNEIGERVTVTVACPSYFRSNLLKRMLAHTEVERIALERTILGSARSASDLAPTIIKAAFRGDLYFFPPGQDRLMWRLKRLMPVRTLKLMRTRAQRVFSAVRNK
jgi:short-subunit dehydrogenase